MDAAYKKEAKLLLHRKKCSKSLASYYAYRIPLTASVRNRDDGSASHPCFSKYLSNQAPDASYSLLLW